MSNLFFIILSFSISFFSAYFFVPLIRKWIEKKKRLEDDHTKIQKPRLKSLEGLITVLLFIFVVSAIVVFWIFFNPERINLNLILAGFLTIILLAFFGYLDDILRFPVKGIRVLIVIFASVPIIFFPYEKTVINLPLLGAIEIYIFLYILLISLIIGFTSLIVNAAKTFNTLIINNSLIILATLFITSWIRKEASSMIFFAVSIGYLLVLRDYLIQKARLSLGKTGRLTLGGIFSVGAIMGDAKLSLVILIIPFVVYFIIKKMLIYIKGRRIAQKFAPLIKITFFGKKLTRKRLAMYLLVLQIICAVFALIVEIYRN